MTFGPAFDLLESNPIRQFLSLPLPTLFDGPYATALSLLCASSLSQCAVLLLPAPFLVLAFRPSSRPVSPCLISLPRSMASNLASGDPSTRSVRIPKRSSVAVVPFLRPLHSVFLPLKASPVFALTTSWLMFL